MTAVEHLNHLDALIVEKTTAPVTAALRNALSPALEQVEALHAEYLALKNSHTVLKNQSEHTITGLNEENAKLVTANKELVAEQQHLKAQAAHPEKKSGTDLHDDAVKILKFFFDNDRHFSEGQVASEFKLSPSVAKYHMDTLWGKKLIGFGSKIIVHNQPMQFKIMSSGRAYIMEHGLSA